MDKGQAGSGGQYSVIKKLTELHDTCNLADTRYYDDERIVLPYARQWMPALSAAIDKLNSHASLSAENATLREQRDAMAKALKAWDHWYSVDSTEFNRDTARDLGRKALRAALSPDRKGP